MDSVVHSELVTNHGPVGNRAAIGKRWLVLCDLSKLPVQAFNDVRRVYDFPPYTTVYSFYRRAKINGLWDKILKHLVKKTRTNAGRAESGTL